ncbi:hypothetical protein ACQPTN_23190 [Bradyrhizobium sp. 13971]
MSSISDDLTSVIAELTQAQLELAEAFARPTSDKTRFDSTKDIPNGYQSLGALDVQLTTVAQSVKGIAESDLTLVPLKQLQSAQKLLQKILGFYRAAIAELSDSYPIHSVDQDNLTFVGEDGIQRSIANELEGASNSLEEFLPDWHLLRLAAKSPRINDFASFLRIHEKSREDLAGSLSKRLIEITKEVSRARVAYYFSIFLLICATAPIAFDIIPRELLGPLLKKLSAGYIEIAASSEKGSQPDLIGHVIARALLLVPALLLVRFAAARHERLFRLREHYAYKYSIASSVEGFKQQSPEQYKDYVALIAFNELTFNPATQMEAKGSETKHLNPLLDAAMKKMGLAPEQQA